MSDGGSERPKENGNAGPSMGALGPEAYPAPNRRNTERMTRDQLDRAYGPWITDETIEVLTRTIQEDIKAREDHAVVLRANTSACDMLREALADNTGAVRAMVDMMKGNPV